MVWNMERAGRNTDTRKDEWKHCDNFIIRPFVNQGEILKHADLFITAGGMNSIHEALYYGVPCLMCPQQGEQRLNAGQFEALGFGRILRDRLDLYGEAMAAMKLKDQWMKDSEQKCVLCTWKRHCNYLMKTNEKAG